MGVPPRGSATMKTNDRLFTKSWSQYFYIRKKLLDGLDCVLCDKPAETLHHPIKKIHIGTKRYPLGLDLLSYWNDETQIPMCRNCHWDKCHVTTKHPATKRMKEINPNIVSFSICRGGGFDG